MSYWFKPREKGYGTAPAKWKGSLVALGFLGVVVAFLTTLVAVREHLTLAFFAVWAAAFIATELLFIWIAWKKTDRDWRWRQGSEDTGK